MYSKVVFGNVISEVMGSEWIKLRLGLFLSY